MAYLAQQEEENKPGQPGQPAEVKTNENVIGGQTGAIGGAGGSGGQGQGQAPNQPSKSGSFTNLQSYVSANKGNDGAMGQAIQNNTDQKIGGVNQQADGFKNTATSAIDAGTTKVNSGLLSQIQNDPTKVDQNAFKANYNATYQGPNSADAIDGYTDVNKGYEDLTKTGQQLGEFSGRQNILNNTYGQGQKYSQGEQRLDSFILGAGEQGQQALNTIGNNINNASTGWGNTLSAIGQGIQGGIATTKATQDATHSAFDNAVGNSEGRLNSIQGQAASLTGMNNVKTTQLKNTLTYGIPGSPAYTQALEQIGLMPSQAAHLIESGVHLGDLVKANAPVSVGDLADKGIVSNYTALLNLIGAKPEKYNFATSNADKSAYSVDQDAIDSGLGAYQTATQAKQAAALTAAAEQAALSQQAQDEHAAKQAIAAQTQQGIDAMNATFGNPSLGNAYNNIKNSIKI